ncbi:hypothetical protein [Hymenobacter sp. BT491]|uniref:hypothetical protein n=1 Tax=Hymenobacter sp. BT491 TaxID=2766779 RepID=UPI001653AC42|nr:hypothetical protein [Hymenobacter sp. BT491]MBC6988561.1 hypothetical protein [Hymenobacter sp. BT491]
MPDLVLEDITWEDGQDNTAGIQQTVYFIRKSDVETFPALPKLDGATKLEDLAIVAGNIVMKADKKPFAFYTTLEKGGATSDAQGEMDGISFKNSIKLFHPGNKATAEGFARFVKNGSFYILFADLDGEVYLLGHPGYPAKFVSAPGGTGEKTSDAKGRTYTLQSVWSGPAPRFTGKVMVGAVEQVLVFLA